MYTMSVWWSDYVFNVMNHTVDHTCVVVSKRVVVLTAAVVQNRLLYVSHESAYTARCMEWASVLVRSCINNNDDDVDTPEKA